MRKVFIVSETNKLHCSKEQICHHKILFQQTEQQFKKPFGYQRELYHIF